MGKWDKYLVKDEEGETKTSSLKKSLKETATDEGYAGRVDDFMMSEDLTAMPWGVAKDVATGLKDAAITVPQSYSLETLDNIIEGVAGKELADQYRGVIAKAREESPGFTLGAELLSPNPLAKTKLAKAGLAAATDVVHQMGRTNDINPMNLDPTEIALAVGGDKLLRKAGSMFGDYQKMRSKHLNLKDITRFEPKARTLGKQRGEYVDTEDYTRDLLDRLDKQYGFFTPGQVRQKIKPPMAPHTNIEGSTKLREDMGTPFEFESINAGKRDVNVLASGAKRAKQAPSGRELKQRAEQSSNEVNKELGKVFDEWEHSRPDLSVTPSTGDRKVISEQSLNEAIDDMFIDIQNSNAFSKTDRDSITKTVEEVKDLLFGQKGQDGFRTGSATLRDLNEVKTQLYNKISGEYSSLNLSTPNSEAMKRTAFGLKSAINNISGDPNIVKMNAYLEDMHSVREGLSEVVSTGFLAQPTTGNTVTRDSLSMLKNWAWKASDKFRPGVSQVSAEFSQNPRLREAVQGGVSALGPRMFGGTLRGEGALEDRMINRQRNDGDLENRMIQNRSPQSISASMETIPRQLQSYRIPRTVEGLKAENKMVLAKVAQEMPEHFDDFQYIFEKKPEDIPELLRMMMDLMPRAFDKDKYSRIDNEVPPELRGGLTEDIKHNKELSNLDKIEKIDTLNKEGKYYDN